jgi:periplasmic divalent cation tolerance protein
MNPAPVLLYMTAPSQDEVERLRELLLKKLLTGANSPQAEMKSMFHRRGQLDYAKEQLMLAKTTQDHLPVVQQLLCEHYSYDCSCLLALPILGGNPDFLNWIKEETHPQEQLG